MRSILNIIFSCFADQPFLREVSDCLTIDCSSIGAKKPARTAILSKNSRMKMEIVLQVKTHYTDKTHLGWV